VSKKAKDSGIRPSSKALHKIAEMIEGWKPNKKSKSAIANPIVDPTWDYKADYVRSLMRTLSIQMGALGGQGGYSEEVEKILESYRNVNVMEAIFPYLEGCPFFDNFEEYTVGLFKSILNDSYQPPLDDLEETYSQLWVMWVYYHLMSVRLDKVELGALFKIDFAFMQLSGLAMAAIRRLCQDGFHADRTKSLHGSKIKKAERDDTRNEILLNIAKDITERRDKRPTPTARLAKQKWNDFCDDKELACPSDNYIIKIYRKNGVLPPAQSRKKA
jgi:hypothetical protein